MAQVTAKSGVLGADVKTGLLFSTLTGWIVSLGALSARPPSNVNATGVAIFLGAGLVTAGVGRMFSIMGIDKLGPSRHAPIQNSVSPTVAVIAGSFLFAESVGMAKIVGVAAIILGVWSVSTQAGKRRRLGQRTPLRVLLLPLAAGLAIASGDVLRKKGLEVLDSPELALTVGMSGALAIWLIVWKSTGQRIAGADRRAILWFCVSGTAAAMAQLSLLHALNLGELSVVSPIANTQPMIVLILSAVFLRQVERIDARVVLGVVLTVLGVIATSWSV